jgi:hypothetical protein
MPARYSQTRCLSKLSDQIEQLDVPQIQSIQSTKTVILAAKDGVAARVAR